MIEIYQGRLNMPYLANILSKHSEVEINIAKEFLDDNIQNIEKTFKETKSKYEKQSLQSVIDYLHKIKVKTIDGKLNLIWIIDKDKTVKSYPIDLGAKLKYGIKPTDYFKNDDGFKILKADYSKALELIAFDMMYRDLGFSMKYMEKALSNIGITSISDSSIILKFLDGESAIECSEYMKIEDCPYATVDNKICGDYFHIGMYETDRYKDIIDISCRYALTAILNSILKIVNSETTDFKLCGVSSDGIYVMVPDGYAESLKEKIEPAVVRVLGRRFEAIPTVSLL